MSEESPGVPSRTDLPTLPNLIASQDGAWKQMVRQELQAPPYLDQLFALACSGKMVKYQAEGTAI